jgi:ketosteroid isomerase-like protein
VSNAERVAGVLQPLFWGDETEVDAELIDRMAEATSALSSEDTAIVMTGGDQFQASYEGPDGMRAAWRDWMEAFSRIRFRIEGYEQIADNVVALAHQIGTTRHGDVELEQPSAAVWKFREGKVVRIEFHLSHENARESARQPA